MPLGIASCTDSATGFSGRKGVGLRAIAVLRRVPSSIPASAVYNYYYSGLDPITMFECECHRGIRDDFVARIRRKDPMFGIATDEQRTHVLLSDDTPEEFDNFLYRYLISLFASREKRLDSLAAGGRPQGHSRPLTGSLRDPGSG